MRYAIFSDIHGNLQAFEAVLHGLQKEQIDRYFFAGDIVGYGANPRECIELLKPLNPENVAGNHDWAVIGKIDTWFFNPIAKEAIIWTKNTLRKEDFEFLNQLKLVYHNDDFIMVHGTLQEPSYFHYLMDERQAEKMFLLMNKNLCFVGHLHIPGVFIQENEKVRYLTFQELNIKPESKYIVNVGSVGQPRDGNPMASYCILDTQQKTITMKRVNYDVEEAQRNILQAGLPAFLASRLALGK